MPGGGRGTNLRVVKVRVVALVPVVVLALTGCSGEKAVKATPLPPTPAATASPTPVPLEVPDSAKPATAQGAAAFARFYLEVMHRAVISGELEQFAFLSDPTCTFCADVAAATRKEYAAGNSFSGGEYEILSAEASQTSPGADALVDVRFNRRPSERRGPSGAVLSTYPGQSQGLLQIQTRRRGSAWIAKGLRLMTAPT